MKVIDVDLTPLKAGKDTRRLVLLELATSEGLTGRALVPAGAANAARKLTEEVLAGEDPRAAMGLFERMGTAALEGAGAARAALDVALWDLKAQAAGEPLWKTLGGSRPRAVAHLSWDGEAERTAMREWLGRMFSSTGITSASVPAADDPARDAEDLARVLSALGAARPQSAVALHFPGRGFASDAIRHIRTVEEQVDLAWVRSPVRQADVRGARRVADQVTAAVCMGRGLSDIAHFRPYLEQYAANIIELDVGSLGISGSMQAADAAFGFELPVVLTSSPADLAVHLFAALPTAMSVTIGYRASQWPVSALTFEGGRVLAGHSAGHGIRFDGAVAGRTAPASGTRT